MQTTLASTLNPAYTKLLSAVVFLSTVLESKFCWLLAVLLQKLI